jgi:hypothetical protein
MWIFAGEKALDRIVQPSRRQLQRVGDLGGCLIDRGLGLEDGINVAGGASSVVCERDRRASDHVHLASQATTVERCAERRQRTDDLGTIRCIRAPRA